MSAWRGKAIEYLPDFQKVIASANSPMSLWIELWLKFEDAFRINDADVIVRILKYARWSLATKNEDAVQAVCCAFFEHIPVDEKMREQIPQWFSRTEFEQLREIFKYHASDEAVSAIEKRYRFARP